ncbi:Chemotaxis protein LafU [compost metagenome]
MARKKRGGHGGHHGGAWKVAYADFVTTLMALFLILWLVNMIPTEKRKELAEYFRDPLSLSGGQAGSNGLLSSGASEGDLTFEPLPLIKSREEYKNALEAFLEERMPQYMDQIELRNTPEGIEISLIEHEAQVLFPVGSAEPIPRSRVILGEVVQLLKRVPNDIVIGGHTDALPFQGNGSNWTLSAQRADRVRQLLEQQGLSPKRVAGVTGYADRQLFDPKRPFAEENRRISILLKVHKDDGKIDLGPAPPIGAPIGRPVTGPVPVPEKTATPAPAQPGPEFSPQFQVP